MENKNILVSVSGGETSMYMAQWLKKEWGSNNNLKYVFANTGEENEETLLFIEKCAQYFELPIVWVEAIVNPEFGKGNKAKVVSFETASRNGEPFKAMITKHGIPNLIFPHCSRELKGRTIDAYLREIGFKTDYKAIGIRADEIDRISNIPGIIQPLVKAGYTIQDRNRFWRDMPFRLNLKGYEDNCKVCWKKSLRKLLTIAKYHPERFDNFQKWEKEYEYYVPASQADGRTVPIMFFRGNLTVDDILAMSKQPFEDAENDRILFIKNNVQLEFQLDLSNGCVESCEPYGKEE